MKIGAISSTLAHLPFEEVLGRYESLGISAIEIYCAGFMTEVPYGEPGKLLADKLLEKTGDVDRFVDTIARHGMEISAFAVHGEPLSPNRSVAEEYARQFRKTCELAQAAGVGRLTLLAGLPEGAPGDATPNWITCPFPFELIQSYRWQWEERVLPYWREQAKVAESHGVRLCFEIHPGDVVFNCETFLRLRSELGPVAGCNFDPSHMFWQGIDPLAALRLLGDAVYHVHAKDSLVEPSARLNGFMDPKPFSHADRRSWTFRTVGWGHGEDFWRAFMSTLRLIGYEDVVSLEIEGDEFMEPSEGLEKSVAFLKPLLLERKPGVQWWHEAYNPSHENEGAPEPASA